MLTHSDIQSLTDQSGSPFYFFDPNRFRSNCDGMTEAFGSRYNPFILAYSYKANYLPYVCRLVKELDSWAEVVSRMEYDLAIRIGHNPAKIIFNGPVKSQEDIYLALENGSLINLDCEPELEMVLQYAKAYPDREINIGLRINIALSDSEGISHIQNSLRVGRFGFAPAELAAASRKLAAADNLKIVGLHGHTSTTDRSVWCFKTITRTLLNVIRQNKLDEVQYINIGGGFFGPVPESIRWCNVPDWNEYAEAICGVLNKNQWVDSHQPALIIEPGMSLVADTMSFVTQVVSIKRIRKKTIVTVDGSAFHAKPTFHKINLPHILITDRTPRTEGVYDVAGSTCMEKDYLLTDVTGPIPQPGDYLKIDSVGAYTLVMSPSFIHPAPAVWALEEEGLRLIRSRQTLEDVFSSCVFGFDPEIF